MVSGEVTDPDECISRHGILLCLCAASVHAFDAAAIDKGVAEFFRK